MISDSTANVATGHDGAPPGSRWPVSSARSTATYSRRASRSQPRPVSTTAMAPNRSAQPPTTSPATSRVIAIATSRGRKDGAGMWTPAGGLPSGVGSIPAGTSAVAALAWSATWT